MGSILAVWSRSVEDRFGPCPASEVAGVLFTAFKLADLLLGSIHGMLDTVYLVHHSLHITLGLIIRGNCHPCLVAGILMAQETSGFFLNYFLLMRNRTKHWSLVLAFLCFALCF